MNKSFERPYRPVDLNTPLTKSFPFMAMAENLMEEAAFATSGRASLTLARGDELTIVLVALKAGSALEEHPAPAAATVITLSGSIIFTTSADKITLEQGEGVTFTGDILHTVYASEDSAFLVVIGGKHPNSTQKNNE
jgi:quercetin dioxygenase-like cupin family protein